MLSIREIDIENGSPDVPRYDEEVLNASWMQVCPELLPRLQNANPPRRYTAPPPEDIDAFLESIYRNQE